MSASQTNGGPAWVTEISCGTRRLSSDATLVGYVFTTHS